MIGVDAQRVNARSDGVDHTRIAPIESDLVVRFADLDVLGAHPSYRQRLARARFAQPLRDGIAQVAVDFVSARCFGAFELDTRTGELRKHGVRLTLQGQPFQVLTLLLERPGELVSREQLR